mgnify:CR=1 FL=1
MADQYLSQKFQRDLWEVIWDDLLPYKSGSNINFSWFTLSL